MEEAFESWDFEIKDQKSFTTSSATSKIWIKLSPMKSEKDPPREDKKVQKVYSGISAMVATFIVP